MPTTYTVGRPHSLPSPVTHPTKHTSHTTHSCVLVKPPFRISLSLQQLPKSATHSSLQHLPTNAKRIEWNTVQSAYTYGSFFFFKQFPSVTKLKGHETSLKRVFSTPKNCLWTPYCYQNRFRNGCFDNPFRICVYFLVSFTALQPPPFSFHNRF